MLALLLPVKIQSQQLPTETPEKVVSLKDLPSVSGKVVFLNNKYKTKYSDEFILKIISCEGTIYGKTHQNHDKWRSQDWGPLQINDHYHKQRMQDMGLDIYKSDDSLEYGFVLMNESGLTAWSASKFCWSK